MNQVNSEGPTPILGEPDAFDQIVREYLLDVPAAIDAARRLFDSEGPDAVRQTLDEAGVGATAKSLRQLYSIYFS